MNMTLKRCLSKDVEGFVSTPPGSTNIIVKNAREPCVLGLFITVNRRQNKGLSP
jgi:hypothetical protein